MLRGERALPEFALKVTECAHEITEADRQALRDAGSSNGESRDIAAIAAAFFGLPDRLVDAFDIPPDAEFHRRGR